MAIPFSREFLSKRKRRGRVSIDLHIDTKDCSRCLLDTRLAEVANPKDLRAHSALALTTLPAALARPAHTAPPLVRSPRPVPPRSAGAPPPLRPNHSLPLARTSWRRRRKRPLSAEGGGRGRGRPLARRRPGL